MGRPIGIDFGTTFARVACVEEGGRARVLPGEDGTLHLPSVVFFGDDDEVVVGVSKAHEPFVEVVPLVGGHDRDRGRDGAALEAAELVVGEGAADGVADGLGAAREPPLLHEPCQAVEERRGEGDADDRHVS